MISKRNTPELTRRCIELHLTNIGFRRVALKAAPPVALDPLVHAEYVREKLRISVKCYGKYGIVYLYFRGGVRLELTDPVLDGLRSEMTPWPREADLEFIVGASQDSPNERPVPEVGSGFPFLLPKFFDTSSAVVREALDLLIAETQSEERMVNLLLGNPVEFARCSILAPLRLEALQSICAKYYSSGEQRCAASESANCR